MGTREALFRIEDLMENCCDVNKDVFLCFLVYKKAFDCVKQKKVMKTEKDDKDIRYIDNLC